MLGNSVADRYPLGQGGVFLFYKIKSTHLSFPYFYLVQVPQAGNRETKLGFMNRRQQVRLQTEKLLRVRAMHFQQRTEDNVAIEAQVLQKQVSVDPKGEGLNHPVEHLA